MKFVINETKTFVVAFDLIGKRNVYVRTGNAQKGLDVLLAERPLEVPQDMDLRKVNIHAHAFT